MISIRYTYAVLEAALRKELGTTFDILKQPRFEFRTSDAYDKDETIVAPVIRIEAPGERAKWRVQGNRALLKAPSENDQEAADALSVFFEVLEAVIPDQCFTMQHGDLLLIDNLRGYVHTREPIDLSSPIEAKRHLMRTHGRWVGSQCLQTLEASTA